MDATPEPGDGTIELSGSRIHELGRGESCIFVVERGEADLFLVPGDDGAGQRHYLMTVREGSWILDAGLGYAGSGLAVVAAGQPGTSIRRDELPARGSPEIAQHLDHWLAALTDGIARFVKDDRSFTLEVQPGVVAPCDAGEVAGLRQGLCWWEGMESVLYMGIESVDAPWLPLAPRGWALCPQRLPESRALETEEFLNSPALVDTLVAVHRFLGRVLCKALSAQDERTRISIAARMQAGESVESAGWQDIAEVLEPSDLGGGAGAFGPAASSVEAAFLRVAGCLGISTKVHSAKPEDASDSDIISALSRNATVRWRQVVLAGDWYRRDCGPMICLRSEAKEAVAAIPRGPRKYDLVSADGSRQRVTADVAARLQPFAAMLYRPLPPGKLRPRDVVRFAMRGNAKDLWMILLMVVATGLLGLATPALTARIYDVIIPQSERGLMAQIAIILLSSTIISSLFGLSRAISLQRIENRTDSELQSAVWDRILRLPMGFFRHFTAGDLANRAQGISEAHQLLSSTGAAAIFTLPTALFNLIVMFYYSVPLALWGLGLALAGMLISCGFNLAEVVLLRRQYEIRGRLSGLVFQLINGVAKFRMANAESFAFAAWAREYAAQESLSVKAGKWRVASETFFSGFSLLSTALVFGLVAWQMGKATAGQPPAFTTGTFLAFNTAFGALIAALISVGQSSLSLLQLVPLLERTKPIFEAMPEISSDRVNPGQLQGEIELANIRFSYGTDAPPVLSGFSLKIRPAEMIAIVGPSGCGKSTIFRLLLGFETPDAGSIFYDGKDIQTLDLREVRRQTGVVLQTTRLVTGDIFRNIVGESNLTLDDAWEAAELAGLADDIRAMPMQMHTVISEGGGGFSGGQKQRLAIARAFAHKPRMLLFDEATSALDNRTQSVVTESLERMQVTRVIIAHRLSTIAKADRIIVLRNGTVCEEGTYDELLAKRGFFHELAQRQIA